MADNREAVGHGRLTVVRTDTDDITVLGLDDRDGADDVPGFGRVAARQPSPLTIDLAGVTFMDSSGVNALISAFHTTQAAQGWLRLAGARGAVLRTLQLVGLDTFVPFHPTLEDALAATDPDI